MAGTTKSTTLTKAGNEPRVFIYNGTELEDIDSNMDDKAVKGFYEQMYPELTTATLSIAFEDRNGIKTKVVTFKKAAGTKG